MKNLIPSIEDVLTFGGLGLLTWGVWQVSPAAALIALGLALFLLGTGAFTRPPARKGD